MTLIEVVILAGAQCLSPIQESPGTTEVGKVPCAVLVRLDRKTGDVEFSPPSAATDPQVIAMLVKPGREQVEPAAADAGSTPAAEGDAQEVLPAPGPLPREKPSTLKQERQKTPTSVTRAGKTQKTATATKRQRTHKRRDACGSYRAVWYTNKEGRRKYRCVRTG